MYFAYSQAVFVNVVILGHDHRPLPRPKSKCNNCQSILKAIRKRACRAKPLPWTANGQGKLLKSATAITSWCSRGCISIVIEEHYVQRPTPHYFPLHMSALLTSRCSSRPAQIQRLEQSWAPIIIGRHDSSEIIAGSRKDLTQSYRL